MGSKDIFFICDISFFISDTSWTHKVFPAMLQDLSCVAKNYIMVQPNLQPVIERKRAAYEPLPETLALPLKKG